MTEPRILLTGLAFGESPRWHDGRLWLSNWGTQQVVALDPGGNSEVVARIPTTFPFSIDWRPDGRLLVVSGQEALLLRREPDGSLVTHADLSGIDDVFNEIVVDGRGNAYVNSGSAVALVPGDGPPRPVAGGLSFGNGMAVTPDNSTLIVAESHGNRLTAFDIAADGSLSGQRVWAGLDGFPDGICLDAEGAIWYGDVPGRCCVRVREGGEVLQKIELDRGCFACMLGGADGTTLFMLVAEWHGMEHMTGEARTGRVLTARAPAPGAGWP